MKNNEKIKNLTTKVRGGLNMKNWTWKKKLLVGAGVLGTAVVGALAYGKTRKEEDVTYQGDSEDEDDYEYESEDEDDQEETVSEVQEAE